MWVVKVSLLLVLLLITSSPEHNQVNGEFYSISVKDNSSTQKPCPENQRKNRRGKCQTILRNRLPKNQTLSEI